MSLQNTRLESAFVRVLVILFGVGSWIAVSGIWSEIPTLILLGVPEQYSFASYMSVAMNLAFVGPLTFVLFNQWASQYIRRPEIPANYVLTFTGMVGAFLLVFFWDAYTVWGIDNSIHSTALLCIIFVIAITDTCCKVSYVGYMSILKPHYVNWFWLGQGMCGLLPAVLSVIQTSFNTGSCVKNFTFINKPTVGNETLVRNCTVWKESPANQQILFGPDAFFTCLFVMMLLCNLAFIGLNILPCAKREYSSLEEVNYSCCGMLPSQHANDNSVDNTDRPLLDSKDIKSYNSCEKVQLDPKEDLSNQNSITTQETQNLSRKQIIFLYVMTFLSCGFSYGILSNIQSFSAGAYGTGVVNLVFPLTEINLVFSYTFFLWKPIYSFTVVIVTFLVGCTAGCYCLAVACMSPNPPLHGLLVGKIIIVTAWLTQGFFMNYCQAAIVWIFRNGQNNRMHLIWNGFVGQLSVFLGTVIIFPIINVARVFYDGSIDSDCDGFVTCE